MKQTHRHTWILLGWLIGGGASAQTVMPQDHIKTSPATQNGGAEGGDAGAAPAFEDLDKDHHGQLHRGDIPKDVPALAQLRAHFAEADVNHDGQISPAEYHQYVDRATGHH